MAAVIRRTKIVATIGPASARREVMHALAAAGMDAARLNFSHGTHADHGETAELVRSVQEEIGRPLAIIADLQGPKLRLGELPGPRLLVPGEEIVVVGEQAAQDGELPIAPEQVGEMLRPGNDILIDDGLVRLAVEAVESGRARCRVLVGGEVSSHKGVNLPGVPIPVPSLTQKDLEDLEFALSIGVDYVALSFVRAAADVRDLQAIIRNRGSSARVIAKIEKAEAVDALDEVLAEADALMVARGDLGVEIGAATVPLIQKQIIRRCLEVGKPVITATQMLESMVSHAEPTRAEASDVANAILDGTSAIMLSAETAVGAFAVEAVRTMDNIARAVEPSMGFRRELEDEFEPDVRRAIAAATTELAEALGAKVILAATATGRTASQIARLRPRRPMLGLSHHQSAVQQMALEWGVLPLLMPSTEDVEELWTRSIETARMSGIVDPGDLVVLVAGTAVNLSGSTNVIKVDIA
ncbi:MAG: pyruvate kinase [Actinobacteria bacterium]|nr:pyruvate kinase [Actinomycetota bacterium]MBV8396243.1 pyruvate kinase [Actinomycetota bacterium]